jgi:TPR repeat protein
MAVKGAAGRFSDASGKINGTTIGMVYVAMAAVQGSEFACSLMARAHEMGLHGLNLDKSQAKEWYYKMDQCEHKDADERSRALRDKFVGNDSSDEDEGDDEGEGED